MTEQQTNTSRPAEFVILYVCQSTHRRKVGHRHWDSLLHFFPETVCGVSPGTESASKR